ncbi:Developmental regulator flbA [Pyrenophora teres f. maculata]|nr:Developmental regulator flbA [Pyrenophora teres f. maculata]
MPFQTTTLLPLTESVSSVPDSLTKPASEPLDSRAHHSDRLPSATEPSSSSSSSPSPPASAAEDSPVLTASLSHTNPPPPPSRSANHARRYTLSRFPLLRKGSRELSRTPSTTANPAPSPLHSTRPPRASQSIARPPDTSATRQNPTSPHQKATLTAPDSRQRVAQRPGEGKPDKMHQTSSRLLRMTDDERPFTRDFEDLFSTLMVSLPLTPHRVRFRMIDFTFTSDEAITNLGSLKFSQSNRMPDPKDSSRVVTTTTTTTFSMAKEMARSVCQKFLEAKFVESVEGKTDFMNKSSVWQLTPKGIHILERFCTRNGIASAHVRAVIESNRNPRQLVVLERNTETDKLHHDEQTVEIIFRRFIGTTANETQSDSDSIHEFSKCDIGVKLVKHRPNSQRQYEYTFHGRNAAQWLMDCSTMVDPREAAEVGSLFLQLKLIAPVDPRNSEHQFQPVKQVHYYITTHGERVAGWLLEEVPTSGDVSVKTRDGIARDSNSNRTNVIIRNPSWRLLYREFLKETMCEENLSFYLEVQQFNKQYKDAINDKGDNKVEVIRETLAAAYGLYNAFLAPGSPNELNIDHGLRTQLATRMTRAVGDDTAMLQSLNEVASLFEKAQQSIFKLMSSDSVPKFVKHPKYAPQLRGLDAAAASASSYISSTTARS